MRLAGSDSARATVVFAPGGGHRSAPGTWSSGYSWLIPRLSALRNDVRVGWLRYSDRSWSAVHRSAADLADALDVLNERDGAVVLVGFSMGAGVCLAHADAPGVTAVIGLAPWFPDPELTQLTDARLRVLHGTRDGFLPLLPGVRPSHSQHVVQMARERGLDAEWEGIPGGIHGWVVRSRGRFIRLPAATLWRERIDALVSQELSRAMDA